MVLLHLLHLLLLLTLQVLQLCVKELLLGLEGAEREIQESHLIPGREMGKAQSPCSDLGLNPRSTTSLLCDLGQVTEPL